MDIDLDAIQTDLELFESRLKNPPMEICNIDIDPEDGDVKGLFRRIKQGDGIVLEGFCFDQADIGGGEIADARWFVYIQYESVCKSGWYETLGEAAESLAERTPASIEVPIGTPDENPSDLAEAISGMQRSEKHDAGRAIKPTAEDTSASI